MTKKLFKNAHLIIDAKWLAHVALFSYKDLSTKGKPIGVVFGVWKMLLERIKKLRPSRLYVAWDDRRERLYRTIRYPEYKIKRIKASQDIKTKERFYEQINELMEIFNTVALTQQLEQGLEADDLIALYCRRNPSNTNLIHSKDSDLFQLLNKNVRLYDGKSFTTYKKFTKIANCAPEQWALVKALAGCPTDNIKGIRGVGEKTAVKIIRGEYKKTLNDYRSVVEQNLPLVKLPYPGVSYKNLEITEASAVEAIDWEKLLDIFIDLDFRSLIDQVNYFLR